MSAAKAPSGCVNGLLRYTKQLRAHLARVLIAALRQNQTLKRRAAYNLQIGQPDLAARLPSEVHAAQRSSSGKIVTLLVIIVVIIVLVHLIGPLLLSFSRL